MTQRLLPGLSHHVLSGRSVNKQSTASFQHVQGSGLFDAFGLKSLTACFVIPVRETKQAVSYELPVQKCFTESLCRS